MTTYSSNDVQMVDTYGPSYVKTLSQISNNEEISLFRFIDPAQWAAIQNGTSTYNAFNDLSAAFTSGASIFAPAGIYRFSGDLPATNTGVTIRGAGGGEYTALNGATAGQTILERQDAGTTGSAVITLGDSATLEMVQVRPANFAAVDYAMANYPSGTGNVGVGVALGVSSQVRHVTAIGFPVTGFLLNTTGILERCYGYNSDKGFMVNPNGSTDGSLINCIGMFCHTAGADLQDNYWSVIGGRYEWNARYGVILGAESVCTGVTFDRNGFAGLWIAPGMWGKTVTGNYFSRNGCGGDGHSGRWSFSVPGDPSYVAVPAGESCHIQVDYEHAVTITGNRFRAGQDDSNQGSNAPQFVYGGGPGTASGATPTNGIAVGNNMGDRHTHSVIGYVTGYAGGTGHPAGGPDTALNTYLNGLS